MIEPTPLADPAPLGDPAPLADLAPLGDPVPVTPDGHPPEHWAAARAAAERLDLATLARRSGLGDGDPLIVLAAHPDDETLGLGRLIHRWAAERGPVSAIVASAGEACLDHVGTRPPDLAERRLREWRAGTTELGVSRWHTLGLPDGSLAGCQPALVAALGMVAEDLLTTHHRVLLAAPWRRDPHPDHRAVGRAAGAVGRRLHLPVVEFGVWMTYWSDPSELAEDRRRLAVLETDASDDEAHRRACAAFVTQLESLVPGHGPVVPPSMLAHHHEQLLVLPAQPGRKTAR